MYEVISLTTRNVKIFIRDKTAVFFSLLSVIILLAIYILFLGNAFSDDSLSSVLTPGELDFMTYSIMMSGVLVINTLTLSLGNLGNIISDFEYKMMNAFLVTPIRRYKIILAYYLSSLLITVTFTLFMWFLAIFGIGFFTGVWYNLETVLITSGLLVLFTFISTAFMIFLTTWIKSVNAFGAVAGIFGTIIGFMSGIYMPLSILPEFVRNIASVLPFTHMTILLKRVMFQQSLDLIVSRAPEIPIDDVKYGIGATDLAIFGVSVDMFWIMLISTVISVLLLLWATARLSKRIQP